MANVQDFEVPQSEVLECEEIEIVESGGNLELGPTAGSSTDYGGVSSAKGSKGSERESPESIEREMAKLGGEMDVLKIEMAGMKREAGGTRAEFEARTWRLEGRALRLTRASDWFQTQVRSVETYIGRARRETFDCRLKFKREAERDAREYLTNLDAQINRIRVRLVLIDAEVWPRGGPPLQDLRSKFEEKKSCAKGKGRRDEKDQDEE